VQFYCPAPFPVSLRDASLLKDGMSVRGRELVFTVLGWEEEGMTRFDRVVLAFAGMLRAPRRREPPEADKAARCPEKRWELCRTRCKNKIIWHGS